MLLEIRMSTDQLSEFRSHTRQRQHITRSHEGGVNSHTPRRTRNATVSNVNNNANLRFGIRTKNR